MGWFDAVATRYGCSLQGATEAALTNLDVLGYLHEIPICTAYIIERKISARFPTNIDLERAKPQLERLAGWGTDISGVRTYGELPAEARRYVERIEELIGVPIRSISVGPKREQLIERG